MSIYTGLRKGYGTFVGTVSKVAYPVHICTSFAGKIFTKAYAINYLFTLPSRAYVFWYSRTTMKTKAETILNIKFDIQFYTQFNMKNPDKVGLLLAAGSTLFTPQELKSTWRTALNDAKVSEQTTENTLCFGDILCNPGDQYGLLDWAYDNILP